MHTPGPWTCHSGMVWAETTADSDGYPIAHMDRNTDRTKPTERDANARLIAAAPEILESLIEMTSSLVAAIECGVVALDPNDENDADWADRLSRARTLLARIEGR